MLKNAIVLLLVFLAGAAASRFGLPAKVVEKEHIVVQEKIVIKEVEKKTTNKHDNRTYIRIVTTHPDGTKTVETRIIDKDTTLTIDNTTTDSKKDVSTVTDKEKTSIYGSNVIVSLGMDTDLSYNASVQKKIIGPLYLGVFGTTSRIFGFNIGVAL